MAGGLRDQRVEVTGEVNDDAGGWRQHLADRWGRICHFNNQHSHVGAKSRRPGTARRATGLQDSRSPSGSNTGGTTREPERPRDAAAASFLPLLGLARHPGGVYAHEAARLCAGHPG